MNLNYRTKVTPEDCQLVRQIVESTHFFYDSEVDIAVELVQENLDKGEQVSGYSFIFAMDDTGETIGYSCYGEIPGTEKRYDLYWIAVENRYRGTGIGKQLLIQTEEAIRNNEGKIIYIETSTLEKYLPTRKFYVKNGYKEDAILEDYYKDGDGKLLLSKRL